MLTRSDLNQIRGVVHEEVDVVVEKKLKPIKKDLRYLKKTVDLTVKNYDEGDIKLFRRISFVQNPVWRLPSGERRVKRIEGHIGLTS